MTVEGELRHRGRGVLARYLDNVERLTAIVGRKSTGYGSATRRSRRYRRPDT